MIGYFDDVDSKIYKIEPIANVLCADGIDCIQTCHQNICFCSLSVASLERKMLRTYRIP